MLRKPFLFLSALASAAALCAVLAWTIVDRATILRDGREIVLKTEPVDPRDLLRGRYVQLNYTISRIPPFSFTEDKIGDTDSGTTVFVRLRQGGDGFWDVAEARIGSIPDDRGADDVWIRGKTRFRMTSTNNPTSVTYGIERFYTPEAVAPEIEKRMRDREITEIVVAVADDGRAQIKALRQAGNTIYTERLY